MTSLVDMFVTPVLLSLLWLHLADSSPVNSPALARHVQVNNDLALNMLQSLSNEDNTFFSPLSLTTALLTLLNGADGQTDKELRHALEIKEDDDLNSINRGMKSILESLEKKNSNELSLKFLTRLLVQQNDNSLKQQFINTVRDELKSDVREVDFQNNAKQVTRDLNEWIQEKTENKIPRLFRDTLSERSSLVLANAVYFSGKWKKPFNRTAKRDFHNFISYQMPGLATSIPFMSLEDSLRSKSAPELKSTLIELPYSQNMSMIVVLPDSQENLQFLNENMTSSQLNKALDDLMAVQPSPLRVSMPRFKLEADYDLKEPLEESFEVKSLFSSADLSKALKQQGANLMVSQAVHRASIDVNEEGVEAAAATGVQLQYLSLPPEVVVDKPFVFLIRDEKSGLIAFMGRVQTLVDEELLGLGFI